jgi:hypothetical protein
LHLSEIELASIEKLLKLMKWRSLVNGLHSWRGNHKSECSPATVILNCSKKGRWTALDSNERIEISGNGAWWSYLWFDDARAFWFEDVAQLGIGDLV